MTISEALQNFLERPPPTVVVELVPVVQKAEARVYEKYAPKEAQDPPDIEEILERVTKNAVNGTLGDLPASDLRFAAAPMVSGQRDWDDEFLMAFLAEVDRRSDKWLFRALLGPYLMNFEPSSRQIQAVAVLLEGRKSFLSKTWRRCIKVGGLLDFQNGPSTAAKELLASPNLANAKRTTGLWGAFSGSGFMGRALAEAGSEVAANLTAGIVHQTFGRFVEMVAPHGKIDQGYASEVALIALVIPFENEPVGAGIEEARQKIQKLVVESFGDPRTKGDAWPIVENAIRQKSLKIVRNWLIFETIDLFLQVIDKTAPATQWEKRRNLWKAFFDAGTVTEAWVVLADNPHRRAQRIKLEGGKGETLAWGRLQRGVDPGHSVLLMKIGDIVIAEWSHNGKFRLWRNSNKDKPDFYEPSYTGIALRDKSDDEVIHLGNWVPRVEGKIKNETGISI